MRAETSRPVSMEFTMRNHGSREGSSGDRRSKRSENLQMKPTISVIDENRVLPPRKDSRYGSDSNLSMSRSENQIRTHETKRKDSRYASHTSLSNINEVESQKHAHNTSQGITNQGFTASVGGSINNMTVVREQYCSCTRWSKLEKTLVITVSVLAAMVLCLVTVVGILAEEKSRKPNGWWSF